jgi:hypothetical protein
MEQKLKRALRKFEEENDEIKYPLDSKEDIEYLANQLEQIIDLPFGLYIRGSSDGMDFWLQCEYYSKKLQKTIIWDHDFTDSYEGEAELIDRLVCADKCIRAFERRLSIKK